MKAKIIVDTVVNVLTLKYRDVSITFGISKRIQYVKLLTVESNGYIEFETNIGIESADFLYDIERYGLSAKQDEQLRKFFQQATVDDFEVRCDTMSNVSEIKEQAYMQLCGFAFVFEKREGLKGIRVYSLHDTRRSVLLSIVHDKCLRVQETNMSEATMYKCLYVAERNKDVLIQGYLRWESTQS